MPSDITLLLKGLLVLAAKEGQEVGKIGILKNFPSNHDLKITVTRTLPDGSNGPVTVLKRADVKDTLNLDITNAAHPKITKRDKTPVNRHVPATNTNRESFAWVVDLEGSELYDKPIGVDVTGFSSILTFNGGELYTAATPNESILQMQPGEVQPGTPAPFREFGRVALLIGIDFKSAANAVFTNGSDTVFDSSTEPGTNYKIDLTHDAPTHGGVVEDADFYYTAVGTGIPQEERILFMSVNETRLLQSRLEALKPHKHVELETGLKAAIEILVKTLIPPIGPEAACFTAYLSRTDIQ